MLSIGDGIALGCAIIAAMIALCTFLRKSQSSNPGNPSNKYVLQKVFDANTESTNRQLESLSDLVSKSFEDLRTSIRAVHGRIDDLYGPKTK